MHVLFTFSSPHPQLHHHFLLHLFLLSFFSFFLFFLISSCNSFGLFCSISFASLSPFTLLFSLSFSSLLGAYPVLPHLFHLKTEKKMSKTFFSLLLINVSVKDMHAKRKGIKSFSLFFLSLSHSCLLPLFHSFGK